MMQGISGYGERDCCERLQLALVVAMINNINHVVVWDFGFGHFGDLGLETWVRGLGILELGFGDSYITLALCFSFLTRGVRARSNGPLASARWQSISSRT